MPTASKKEIVLAVANKIGRPTAEVSAVCQSYLDQIVEELAKGNRLEFREFGVFEIKERAPRVAQNPRTLERVPVPEPGVEFRLAAELFPDTQRRCIDEAAAADVQGTDLETHDRLRFGVERSA